MGDQVRALIEAGVRGSYLNSTLTPGQQRTVMKRAVEERTKSCMLRRSALPTPRISGIRLAGGSALDCGGRSPLRIPMGQDFRPSYLAIREFIESFEKRPIVVALTATATERVRNDITALRPA